MTQAMKKIPVRKSISIQKFTCPECKSAGTLTFSGNNMLCRKCKKEISGESGFFDFAGESMGDNFSFSQWTMEFPPVVSIYENIWRPAITIPFSNYEWEKKEMLSMLELNNCQSALDLACGTGNFTRLISDSCKNINREIVGVDLSAPMLKRAVKNCNDQKYSHIVFVRANVLRWNFAPESFDRIHCAGALHLFPEIQQVFHSIAETLNPNGLFAGATYIQNTAGGGMLKNALEPFLKFHWFKVEELKELAFNAGLTGWEHRIKKQGIVFKVRKK
jgi:ubiquinone/menaquinone biosynthesis C-methylase UbiE